MGQHLPYDPTKAQSKEEKRSVHARRGFRAPLLQEARRDFCSNQFKKQKQSQTGSFTKHQHHQAFLHPHHLTADDSSCQIAIAQIRQQYPYNQFLAIREQPDFSTTATTSPLHHQQWPPARGLGRPTATMTTAPGLTHLAATVLLHPAPPATTRANPRPPLETETLPSTVNEAAPRPAEMVAVVVVVA